jgi:hypothetical protein
MTLTQEQQNGFNLIMKNTNPAHVTVDQTYIDEQMKEHRAAQEKARPPKTEDPGDEYGRLKQWADSLSERLSGSGRTINRAADRVKGFEEKIKNMKTYAATQNPTAQKPWASKIEDQESNLAEAERFLAAQLRVNKALLTEQRNFPSARLAELRKQIQAAEEMYRLATRRVGL